MTADQFEPVALVITTICGLVMLFEAWCLFCTIRESHMSDDDFLRSSLFWPFPRKAR